MFCRRQKQEKQQKDLEVRDQESSKDPKPDVVVQDTQTTSSAPADEPKNKAEKIPWWHRLFGRKQKSKHQGPETATTTQAPQAKPKKWWHWLLGRKRRQHQAPETENAAEEHQVAEPEEAATAAPEAPEAEAVAEEQKTLESEGAAEESEAPETDTSSSVSSSDQPKDDGDVQEVPPTSASSSIEEEDLAVASDDSDIDVLVERFCQRSSTATQQETPEAEVVAEEQKTLESEDATEESEAPETETSSSVSSNSSTATQQETPEANDEAEEPEAAEPEDAAEEPNLPSSAADESDDSTEVPESTEAEVQAASSSSDPQDPAATDEDPANDTDGSSPVTEERKESSPSSNDEPKDDGAVKEVPPSPASSSTEVKDLAELLDWSSSPKDESDDSPPEMRMKNFFQQLSSATQQDTLPRNELVCLGFPNLGQTCYVNSTLQGLLTLRCFVQEVHNQERVWSSHSESQIFSGIVKAEICHFTPVEREKKMVLAAFKRTVSTYNEEFADNNQKDAHELLSCVLSTMKFLSLDLHTAAINMGLSYTCPVDAHIAFKMLSTRTCRGCGLQSKREEDYINLSLDVVPGGSVSQSLQKYLSAQQLEYRCECGARESSQQWSFLSLPNVLIVQLQRFRVTPFYTLEKVNTPVALTREMAVIPESGALKKAHYSLVSVISHLGSTVNSGHYICDGVYRQKTDRWLTYNDMNVSETTRESVCSHRRGSAYILFYEKQM